jgi:hypothetical protein
MARTQTVRELKLEHTMRDRGRPRLQAGEDDEMLI